MPHPAVRALPGSALALSVAQCLGCRRRDPTGPYSVITRSAHSTSETKIAGLPYFAP